MATIGDIPAQLTAPASGDKIPVRDVSVASGDKDKYMLLSQIAVLSLLNTFTAEQTIAPATNTADGLVINMPSATSGMAIEAQLNGVVRSRLNISGSNGSFELHGFDNGTGTGAFFYVGNNTNGSTPAPGALFMEEADGGNCWLWPDNSEIWRTSTAGPTNATYTGGTVVGSQSSHKKFKKIVGKPVSDAEALALVVEAAKRVKRFVYKNGAFGGEEFSGIVLDGDTLDRYGMDADADHKAGKSLNEITAIGDLFLAMRGLVKRVEALEAQLAAKGG